MEPAGTIWLLHTRDSQSLTSKLYQLYGHQKYRTALGLFHRRPLSDPNLLDHGHVRLVLTLILKRGFADTRSILTALPIFLRLEFFVLDDPHDGDPNVRKNARRFLA